MKKLIMVVLSTLLMSQVFATNKFVEQKVLNIGLFWLPSNLNPTVKWNGWQLVRVGIGENLVQVDENMKFKAVIAKSWKVVDNKTTIFTIRDGVTFHNGDKVDALAVKKSLEHALNAPGRKGIKFPLESITADGNRLIIKTSQPYSILLNNLADPLFAIVTGFNNKNFSVKPIATGPFKVDKFKAKEGVWLSSYKNYWGGKVKIDKINSILIKNATTRAMAMQSGELDLVTQIEPSDLKMLEKTAKYNIQKGPNARIFMLRFNMQKDYMKNLDFRKALIHAVDLENIVKNIAKGYIAKGPFPPMYDFAYKKEVPYTFNVIKAKKLLDNAKIVDTNNDGIREFNGKNIVLKYYARTGHGATAKNIGVAIQSAFKNIGISLEINQIESISDVTKQGKFDLVWERWTAAPGMDSEYFLKSSFQKDATGNRGKYKNTEFNEVVEKLSNTLDKKKRDILGQKAVDILLKDAPAIFMYHGEGNIVTNKKIKGVYRFPSEIYYIDSRISMD